MASRMILRRMARCQVLEYALLAFRDKVSVALEERFRPFLEEGETMPSVSMFLTLFARSMRGYSDQLSFVDISRLDELNGDAEVREQLSTAMKTARQRLITARETVHFIYGKAARKRFGFQRRTGRTAIALLEQGRRLVGHLRNPEKLAGLTPRIPAVVDLSAVASEIETALEVLADLHERFEVERRQTTETKIRKDATMTVFDQAFVPQARVIEGLFFIAGFRKLAERVRPTTSKRMGRGDVAEQDIEEVKQTLEEAVAEDTLWAGDSPVIPPTPASAEAG